jgi:hypothetical protein
MTRTPQPGDAVEEVHESRQSLWRLLAAPSIWLAHFLASYVTAAVWCAKVGVDGSRLSTVRLAIGIYTAVALAGIGLVGHDGYRRHRHGTETGQHDFDTAAGRHRFLGFATLLLAAMSAVATLYVALAALFIERCW